MSVQKPINSHLIATAITAIITALLAILLYANFGQFGDGNASNIEAMEDETFMDLEDLMLEDFEFKTNESSAPTNPENQLSTEPAASKGNIKQEQATQDSETKPIETTINEPIPPIIEQKMVAPVAEIKIDSAKTVMLVDSAIANLMNAIKDASTNDKKASSTKQKTAQERFEFYKNNYRLIRNFQKVYPYAIKTRMIIQQVNEQLASITNDSKKKKLIKEMEDNLIAEYEGAVRKMSVSQGRLLLKLIARETNKTGYELIKEYRGAFSASFWYGVGKIFGTDLKTKYDVKEDSVIENVLDKYNKNELY